MQRQVQDGGPEMPWTLEITRYPDRKSKSQAPWGSCHLRRLLKNGGGPEVTLSKVWVLWNVTLSKCSKTKGLNVMYHIFLQIIIRFLQILQALSIPLVKKPVFVCFLSLYISKNNPILPTHFASLPSTYYFPEELKLCISDWNLTPVGRTHTWPKPSLGLKPIIF